MLMLQIVCVLAGAGLQGTSALKKQLLWALVGVGSAVLCMAMMVWFWRSVLRNFRQKVAGS